MPGLATNGTHWLCQCFLELDEKRKKKRKQSIDIHLDSDIKNKIYFQNPLRKYSKLKFFRQKIQNKFGFFFKILDFFKNIIQKNISLII